ncbi:MAG TPA: alginate lyase family protein [Acidimicrobiales bacterium]|nr:alginate lyase family protein [Acidimicrobiales bacterium]
MGEVSPGSPGWYVNRLRAMSAREVSGRLVDGARRRAWRRRQVPPGAPVPDRFARLARGEGTPPASFGATLPEGAAGRVPADARAAVVDAAEAILAGHWTLLGVPRPDIEHPDWFLDPVTGRRAPSGAYCFSIDHRSESVTGNVKQVWELSRMQHVTVLAAAFALTSDERFARRAGEHLRSWWAQSPFLSGVHWTSGIEVGLRLIAWVWARRLLDRWHGARPLFEENELALAQIWWHQRYLDAFPSRGSSANNHAVAEAAGQLVAARAFPWFDESERWGARAAAALEAGLADNTFPSGVNRELAFEYHGFVAELGLLAGLEADRSGRPLGPAAWDTLGRMLDVVAAVVDAAGRPPRQGDGDDGRGLVLGPTDANRWVALLALGGAVFGPDRWWPDAPADAAAVLLAAMGGDHPLAGRPERRPSHFADAGLTIMRTPPGSAPEIWCRCDAGPHGFLSIAAHAHADALSVEVRHAGVDVLADPGTYCYHGEPAWRRYFRSTSAHNTLEVDGQDQSASGGPFLWVRHARSRLEALTTLPDGTVTGWSAEHDGYRDLVPPVGHRRTVRLLLDERAIEIDDVVTSSGHHALQAAFHLGPAVQATLEGSTVSLWWDAPAPGRAELQLPGDLDWRTVRGATEPVLGWYSPRFGEKVPATTVVGRGAWEGQLVLRTVLRFEA